MQAEEAQAADFHQLLHQQCQAASSELQSLRAKQAETLEERLGELKDINEGLSKRWVQVTRDQAGRRKRLRKIERLRNRLKSQRKRKVHLLMETGLEAIIEQKVTRAWRQLCTAFGTDQLEEVIAKTEDLRREKEALVVNVEEITRYNGGLRRKIQELEQGRVDTGRLHVAGEAGRPRIWKRRRPGLEALAAAGTDYLRRTLATIVKKDHKMLLLPSNLPPFWSLSPVALSLLYTKAVFSALEIANQRPIRSNEKRKSVLFALQIMLHNAITKQSSSQVAKRSSEQFSSHFVRPSNDPQSLQHAEYIGDLLLNVADYERTAIEASKLAMREDQRESWKSLETDMEEAKTTRSELIPRSAKAPIRVGPKTAKELKSYASSQSLRQALAAKELIALNKTRHCLSLHNLKSLKEGNGSFVQLSASLRSQMQTLVKRQGLQARSSRTEEDTDRGVRSTAETGSARSTVNMYMTQGVKPRQTPRKKDKHW